MTPAPAVPGREGPTAVVRLDSILEPLRFTTLFPRPQPVEIELGSGDGSFLVAYAQAHPDRNLVGVERLLGRLRKIDRKTIRSGLTNLRVVRIEAAYFLQHLLPPDSIRALHLYFPDPWPKKRHARHRLVNEAFPSLAAAALETGGAVYLRTDDAPYFKQMQAVFARDPRFELVETPAALANLLTDFEREFLAQGKVTHRAAYRRQ
jgi:tRNA (guanine-N7-)-methyltransferase